MSGSAYVSVPFDGLIAAYPMRDDASDWSGRAHHGSTHNVKLADRMGTTNAGLGFDGQTSVITIPSHRDFSVNTTGYLSISVWMRPDGTSLNEAGELLFQKTEGTGYVDWLGKGMVSGRHGNREWTFRVFSADNTENRANRISFYLFGQTGGRGPGCYVQEKVIRGNWIHLVAMASKPDHRIWLYRNAELVDTDGFGPNDSYPIPDAELQSGAAPVRMGSQDGASYFRGALADVYFYNRKLTDIEIEILHATSGAEAPVRRNAGR
ncbi:LamG-like jellyroll fold domain-containing protein [Nocardia abscessus]|uniref:LamG-like jellyroll fold domain-containing protein n=1 Tax=Nocardia abscessus TaxID=120957 RepID=UPI0024584A2D|nr:LamG-like jellyroll fold domain-containing protein [Nocardia abscessus]